MKPQTVASYIQNISDPDLRRLANQIRAIAKEALPEAGESLKMGVPCYSVNRKMIALIGDYTSHLNLYFPKGALISSPLLQGTGKGMRHVNFEKDSKVNQKEIAELLRKAARVQARNKPI